MVRRTRLFIRKLDFWFVVGMKYIASCSFGKDSLAMVLRLIEENRKIDAVVYYNTGMEFNSIYNNRDKLSELLKSKNIDFVELTNKNHFVYDMLCRPVKYRKEPFSYHYGYGWCGGNRVRWGTSLKQSTINDYYRKNFKDEEIFEYIGIAYDEPERIKDDPHKIYPLVEWKMTEKDCLNYCYESGYDWNENGIELYSVLDRVSCWCCQNKNLKELKNIYLYLPEYWQRLRGLQSRIQEPMKGKGKSVFELEERFKREGEQLKF